MLSNIALSVLIVLSLLLVMKCVELHKENILITLQMTQNNVKKRVPLENLKENEQVLSNRMEEKYSVKKIEYVKVEELKVPISKMKYSNLSALEKAILEEVKKMKKD